MRMWYGSDADFEETVGRMQDLEEDPERHRLRAQRDDGIAERTRP